MKLLKFKSQKIHHGDNNSKLLTHLSYLENNILLKNKEAKKQFETSSIERNRQKE